MANKTFGIFLCFLVFICINSKACAYFDSRDSLSNHLLASSCWVPPSSPDSPNLPDELFIRNSSFVLQWQASISTCPLNPILKYRVKIYADIYLTNLVLESPWINETDYSFDNLTEGKYWWQIEVTDQFNNGNRSETKQLIVDRSAPSATLSISDSWTKTLTEKIAGGDFENDFNGWTGAGDITLLDSDMIGDPLTIIYPISGNGMIRIGSDIDEENWAWENRLMQSFQSGAKSLSLNYNFFSRDYSPQDNPGFMIRLNGQEIFKIQAADVNPDYFTDQTAKSTGWQTFTYDLSNQNSDINLVLYSGNSADQSLPSWTYVDKITTYFIGAPSQAFYEINAGDDISGIDYCRYKVDDNDWQKAFSFYLYDGGEHQLQYYCADKAGNSSSLVEVTVITDTQAPSVISDLRIEDADFDITENSIVLTWTAPVDGSDNKASTYDIRYSLNPINDDEDFFNSQKIANPASPLSPYSEERLEILGLNPNTVYYFAVKSADEAPNWSALSNSLSATTLPAVNTVNKGDVVINEIMWTGSSVSALDQWIELRNLTDREIDLSNFYLTGFNENNDESIIEQIPDNKIIVPHGYFLITKYNAMFGSTTQLKDSVTIDVTNPDFTINSSNLNLKLYDRDWNLIDEAWDGTKASEGFWDSAAGQEKYYSMERIGSPGDGRNPLSWYTCIDALSTAEFFKGGHDERGTPRAPNRSENEPFAKSSLINRISPINSPTPSPELTVNSTNTDINFMLANITNYAKLSYELTYDSDNGQQGVTGSVDLNAQNEFAKKILLGTCSSGGTCVYHSNVKNIKLKCELTNGDEKWIREDSDL